jgi:hypothetical protein
MNKLPCQAGVHLGVRWLGLALLLLLPLALAWGVGAAGPPASGSVGPVPLLRYADTCNLVGGNFPVTEAAGEQGWPRIAYNSQDNTFLVVWQSRASSTADWDICGQMLAGDGAVLSGQAFCLNLPGDQMFPDVAYNSTHNEFLVVWQDNNTANASWDIKAQRITASGVPIGTVFPIAARPGYSGYPTDQQHPAVAYNPDDDEYLVVWQDDYCERFPYKTADDIYGVRLSSSGELLCAFIPISVAPNCSDNAYQQYPAVVYNSSAHQYLVVWEDSRQDGWDIYGQRLANTGALSGGNCALVTAAGEQRFPDLVYNSQDQVYMLSWQNCWGSDWDIYAARVTSDCHLYSPFAVSTKAGDQQLPAVVYSPQKNEYLIVWQDDRNGTWDIYGQRVAADDTLLGAECPIAVTAGDQTAPAVAYDSQADEYLVVWQDDRAGENNDDIYGQRLSLNPTPTPTDTHTPTSTSTPTPTDTPTATSTPTPTPTATPTTISTNTPTYTPTSMPGPPWLIQPADGALLPQPVPPDEWYFSWGARTGPCSCDIEIEGPGGRRVWAHVSYSYGYYEYHYTTTQYLPDDALAPWFWWVEVYCPLGYNRSETRTFSVMPAPTNTPTPTPTARAIIYLPLILRNYSAAPTPTPT